MNTTMSKAILRASFLAASCIVGLRPSVYAASVRGSVVNDEGKPIARAKVEVVNPYLPTNGILEYITADEKGYFSKEGISPGEYLVYGSKAEEGYGDTRFAIFAAGVVTPDVTIIGPKDNITVKLNLGHPGASLRGVLVDDATGKVILGASIKVTLDREPDKYVAFGADEDGGFTHLVPSSPIHVLIKQSEYRQLSIGLDLKAKEEKLLTLTLKRIG